MTAGSFDHTLKLKLCDFGLSRIRHTIAQTKTSMSPKCLSEPSGVLIPGEMDMLWGLCANMLPHNPFSHASMMRLHQDLARMNLPASMNQNLLEHGLVRIKKIYPYIQYFPPQGLYLQHTTSSILTQLLPHTPLLSVERENSTRIDSGGEATIWRARLHGKVVICRDIKPPEQGEWGSPDGEHVLLAIKREISLHCGLKHDHILPIIGISTSEFHPLSIITPYADKGSAPKYLCSLEPMARPAVMLKFAVGIASALDYLHGLDPPLIHGDIHGGNILVDRFENALLSDFGLSRIKHEQTRTSTGIIEGGKDRYIAPELMPKPPHFKWRTTAASDCYAFAMTILELASLRKPFMEYEQGSDARYAAEHRKRPMRPALELFGKLSEGIFDLLWCLLMEMWDHDPTKRPAMKLVWNRLINMSSHV
ncbi:kinase-like protein [Clavulina sp. PMI_390]|nr:kinase-like protein [Clavulina sp. PMI_390]